MAAASLRAGRRVAVVALAAFGLAGCQNEPNPHQLCTVPSIPECDGVTVDEYVACTVAALNAYVQSHAGLSCFSDPNAFPPVAPLPDVCTGPVSRCPAWTP